MTENAMVEIQANMNSPVLWGPGRIHVVEDLTIDPGV